MSSVFIIPVENTPQSFNIALAGTEYIMTCRYNNAQDAGWCMDFTNATTNEVVVVGIPLITGADCLAGLEYLGFQGQMIVYTDGDQTAVPTLDNLGVESNLYFVTNSTASTDVQT